MIWATRVLKIINLSSFSLLFKDDYNLWILRKHIVVALKFKLGRISRTRLAELRVLLSQLIPRDSRKIWENYIHTVLVRLALASIRFSARLIQRTSCYRLIFNETIFLSLFVCAKSRRLFARLTPDQGAYAQFPPFVKHD